MRDTEELWKAWKQLNVWAWLPDQASGSFGAFLSFEAMSLGVTPRICLVLSCPRKNPVCLEKAPVTSPRAVLPAPQGRPEAAVAQEQTPLRGPKILHFYELSLRKRTQNYKLKIQYRP